MKFLNVAFVLLVSLVTTGCELPMQQMGSRERGIVFRRLPTFLGGGLSSSVAQGGAMIFVMPWDNVIRVDTGSLDVTLGERGGGEDFSGFVFTRAKDGNEVALKMTVRYRVKETPETLTQVVQRFGKSNEEIRDLIVAIARAQIRRHMNELRTSEFLREADRYRGVELVKGGIQEQLDALVPAGVEVLDLMLDRFEFARLQPDGSADRSYQEKLNEVLRIMEGMEREQLRIATVKAEGEQREFTTQATVNRMEQEALGYKKQAELRGNAYLTSKQNEAKGIVALGTAEVQGLIERINALEGEGGAAILKLELAKQLQKGDPRFVLMGSSPGDRSLEVQRLDANELLSQMGAFEAMRDSKVTQQRKSETQTSETDKARQ